MTDMVEHDICRYYGETRPANDLGGAEPRKSGQSDLHHVITDRGWSYVVGPTIAGRDGPWRYGWEAQELADELNHAQ